MKEVTYSQFYEFTGPMEGIETKLVGPYPYTRVYIRIDTRDIVAKSTANRVGGVYPPTRRYFIKSNAAEK